MNFNKLNTDQIISVKSFVNFTNSHYTYKKSPKYFKFLYPKEGWYYFQLMGSDIHKTVEQIESSGKLFVKDGYVYHYPHIEIRMSNGSLNTKYFKTEEDLKEYYDTFLAPLNLIDA